MKNIHKWLLSQIKQRAQLHLKRALWLCYASPKPPSVASQSPKPLYAIDFETLILKAEIEEI